MVKLGSVNGNKVFLHLQLPNPILKKGLTTVTSEVTLEV